MFGNIKKEYVDDVKGNYTKTLRLNNDAIERLGWSPIDRLESYIKSLTHETENKC